MHGTTHMVSQYKDPNKDPTPMACVPQLKTRHSFLESSQTFQTNKSHLSLKDRQRDRQKQGQEFTIITCDQAIYEVVLGLQKKNPQKCAKLILRMGGFHIAQTFLKAIWHLMQATGKHLNTWQKEKTSFFSILPAPLPGSHAKPTNTGSKYPQRIQGWKVHCTSNRRLFQWCLDSHGT